MYCYNCMKEIDDNSIYCPFCHATVKDNCAPHHLKPGTVLNNRYLVGNSIGEGGFGITYIGRDLKLDMRIAVKEFYPAGFANRFNTYSNNVNINYKNGGEYFKSGVERFLQEAKSIAKFNNESSIVDVRDYFEENGTAYIIMEYLEGENLSEKLERDGTFEPEEIFKMFLPIMKTLEKMHRENIIHRDITPQNIRVMPDGSFKLIDFGSARYYDGVDKRTLSVQLKPGYAPIEQYNKNGNQGPWTDVYGLCATIYKCITGKTPLDSLERIQNDTLKKPSELGVKISVPLEKVLMQGLAVDSGKRCQNINELINKTEFALSDEQSNLESESVHEKSEDIYSSFIVADDHSQAASDKIIGNDSSDDEYKTMPANRSYGDTGMFKDADPEEFSYEKESNIQRIKKQASVNGSTNDSNASSKQANIQKKNTVLRIKPKIIVIFCFIVVLIVVIIFGFGFCNSNKKDNTLFNSVDLTGNIDKATTTALTFSVSYDNFSFIDSDNKVHLFNIYGDTVNKDTIRAFDDSSDYSVVINKVPCVGVKKDGTVSVFKNPMSSEDYKLATEIEKWTNIKQIAVYNKYIIGLKNDGSVVSAGKNDSNNSNLLNVESWNDIKSITTSSYSIGLKNDGSLVSVDNNENVQEYNNIAALAQGSYSVYNVFLKKDGTLTPVKNKSWQEANEWKNIVQLCTTDSHIVGLKEDGTVVAAGKNEDGQCNVSDWINIVAVQTSGKYTIGKKSDGTFVIATNNKNLKKSFEKVVNKR